MVEEEEVEAEEEEEVEEEGRVGGKETLALKYKRSRRFIQRQSVPL